MNVREICYSSFREEVKGLSNDDANCFTVGIEKYFREWHALHLERMNVAEELAYANTEVIITSFSDHEYWPYSPHFIRVFSKIIDRLFGTSIRYVSISDPGENNRTIILADNRNTAWVIKITNRNIYMMYPRKGIDYRHYERVIPMELHNLSDLTPVLQI